MTPAHRPLPSARREPGPGGHALALERVRPRPLELALVWGSAVLLALAIGWGVPARIAVPPVSAPTATPS